MAELVTPSPEYNSGVAIIESLPAGPYFVDYPRSTIYDIVRILYKYKKDEKIFLPHGPDISI